MIELLAVLSLSAALGLRVAFPLLLIGLIQGELLWSNVPFLSNVHPQVLFGLLMSWSLSELILPKWLLGQRFLQGLQLVLSPLGGAIASLTAVYLSHETHTPLWIFAITGALLALVLQLVQVGWFYRLRGIPLWGIWLQDILCLVLVLSAFGYPHQGGLIAMVLLWLAVRSATMWRNQQYSPYHPADAASDAQSYAYRDQRIEHV